MDFSDFIEDNNDGLIFLDPPYYLEKQSKLYGNNGDMHESFNHNQLYHTIKEYDQWIMTYNNCDYIRELYSDYTIIDAEWSYGMNKCEHRYSKTVRPFLNIRALFWFANIRKRFSNSTRHKSKKSSEIIIINNL
jgi:site-specific DNA-adenine methylase